MSQVIAKALGSTSRKVVLVVLWLPSADREGRTLPDHDMWKRRALEVFGKAFGGATAMPRAEGVWRDDEAGGRLVYDFPVLIECYISEEQAKALDSWRELGRFCRRMGKETKQGEVILLVDGHLHSFAGF